jgi:hypothetical protein
MRIRWCSRHTLQTQPATYAALVPCLSRACRLRHLSQPPTLLTTAIPTIATAVGAIGIFKSAEHNVRRMGLIRVLARRHSCACRVGQGSRSAAGVRRRLRRTDRPVPGLNSAHTAAVAISTIGNSAWPIGARRVIVNQAGYIIEPTGISQRLPNAASRSRRSRCRPRGLSGPRAGTARSHRSPP